MRNTGYKSTIWILVFMAIFFIGNTLFAEDYSFNIENKSIIPIYIHVPSGYSIHHITITIDTHQTAQIPSFVLTYPDLSARTITIGTDEDDDSGNSGYHVISSSLSGIYTFEIFMNPDGSINPNDRGIVTLDQDWILTLTTVTDLASVDISIDSEDNTLTDIIPDRVDLNIPPTATIAAPASNQTINEGQSVSFGGTATDDDTASLTHEWDIDGAAPFSSAEDPGSTTFNTAGIYLVTYTVTDDVGQEAADTVTITVNAVVNNPPTATISAPASDQTIDEGDSLTFAGTATDEDLPSLSHGWDYDSGTTNDSVEDPGAKTFNTAGIYVVTYTVTDDILQTDNDTVTITVNSTPADDPPTANISTTPDPPEGIFHFEITFDGSGSSDDSNVTEYHWDFGDDSAVPAIGEITPTHTYLTGEYTASLIVTDDATTPQDSDPFEVTVKVYPDQEISFPAHRGVPYAPDPPSIDGEIMPEEWRGTHRVTYSTGAAPADVAFQGLKDRIDDYIYLSFAVKKDQGFDPDDLIVINFRPDAASTNSANDRKLFIFPFDAGHLEGDNQDLFDIRIWKDSSGWPIELSAAEVTAIGIESQMKSYMDDGHEAWDIELKIPTTAATADWVDFSDNFLFYFDVNKVNSVPPPVPAPQVPTNIQFTWPIGVPVVTGDLLTYDFDPEWWGRGNASGTAVLKGVFITRNDIGTANSNPSKILLPNTDPGNVTNTFRATVTNESEEETTSPPDYSQSVAANGVKVRFRIANWGIPTYEDWIDLPATAGTDPAAPVGKAITLPQDITGTSAVYELEWNIVRPSQYYTDYSESTHQCILVEIDSDANVNIITRSVYRNMNFGTASDFSQPAEISVRGLGPVPEGKDEHTYLLVITPHDLGVTGQQQGPSLTHADPGSDEGGVTARGSIEWAAHGFLYTGEYIIINGNQYEILDPIGSFGHVVTHVGEVVDWEYEIDGAQKVDENLYIVGVQEESSVKITPIIWPIEFWPHSLSVHAGSVTPIDTLANNYKTGFTVFADFGWRFNKQLMLILLSGINWFPEKSGGQAYWNISTNIDVRYLLPLRGSFIPYIQAGPGVYYDDSGNFKIGVNTGFGFWYDLSSHFHAELGVDYHAMMEPTIQFWSAHGGIVYKF